MWGAIGSIGGGLLSGLGGLFGGSGSSGSDLSDQQEDLLSSMMGFQSSALNKYGQLYNDYYWPIEEFLAGNYLDDIQASRPYEESMRDYQLNRGDELIGLAEETNPLLDDNKKDVIRRLTEGEDVLRDRYRSTATADVTSSFQNQREQDVRNMQTMGINPNSGAYTNYMSTMGTNEALAQAGARTNASWQAEDTSLERQMEANNWYTTPTMQYSAGTIQPGMGIGELTSGASSYSPSYGSSGSSGGGDIWGSLGGMLGGITGGLDQLQTGGYI